MLLVCGDAVWLLFDGISVEGAVVLSRSGVLKEIAKGGNNLMGERLP